MATKRGYTAAVVVAVIALLLFSVIFFKGGFTSFAVLGTRSDMLREVQGFVDALPFAADLGDGSSVCLQIDVGDSVYAYHLEKQGNEITISESRNPDCNGETQEDFILKFTSYEAFLDAKSSPTCQKLLNNGRGQNYWFLPSKLWPKGDFPNCNEEFKEKYCPAIYHCMDPQDAPANTLGCCAQDALSPQQLERSKVAARLGLQGNDRTTKSSILETPLTPSSFAWQFVLVAVILVLVFATIIIIKNRGGKAKKKEEAMQMLEGYIVNALNQDFTEAEIKNELRNKGWQQDAIDSAFAVAQSNRPSNAPPSFQWRPMA